jgi:hypothetical protein
MGWSGRAHSEFTYGALTLGEESSQGGELSLGGIAVNGDNLEITLETSNASGNHALERATDLAAPQWAEVTGVTFAPGAAGTVVATFPKPGNSPEFYRGVLR